MQETSVHNESMTSGVHFSENPNNIYGDAMNSSPQSEMMKTKKQKKQRDYDPNSLLSLINKQDKLLYILRRQIPDTEEFQTVITREIKTVDKQELIKEFGQLDKKVVHVEPIPEEKINSPKKSMSPNSPNIKQAINEARQIYFIKRLRVNVDKPLVLVKEWKYIQRRRQID